MLSESIKPLACSRVRACCERTHNAPEAYSLRRAGEHVRPRERAGAITKIIHDAARGGQQTARVCGAVKWGSCRRDGAQRCSRCDKHVVV